MYYQTNEKSINNGAYIQRPTTVDNGNACRIRWLIAIQLFSTILILLLLASFFSMGYVKDHHRKHHKGAENDVYQKRENLTTLYAFDPISSSMSFGTGEYGGDISNWTIYNHGSDIDFNNYHVNSFSVGVEGGRVGVILDLGTAADLQRRYRYSETVGNGVGFASIHRQNQTVYIFNSTVNGTRTFQPMVESAELFQDGVSEANALVQLGHIYLIRITDNFDSSFERIVKMIAAGYRQSESVTIRWMPIP